MNYQKIYDDLIKKAKSENRKKLKRDNPKYVYYEKHHILPKCLGGGNEKENLVLLTAKEHFVCHKLLVEIYSKNNKIFFALHKMTFSKSKGQERRYKISSREYNETKDRNSKINSIRFSGENNPMFGKIGANKGKPKSLNTIRKIKESKRKTPKVICPHCNKKLDPSNATKWHFDNCLSSGNLDLIKKRKHKVETKLKISKSVSGDKNGMSGKRHSLVSKNKMTKSQENVVHIKCSFCEKTGKPGGGMSIYHFDNCKKNPNYKPKTIICPHCNKEGVSASMKRWHFDNCKHK